MKTYNLTIWTTVTYRHDVEVEAADWEAAEDAGRLIFEEADTSQWRLVDSDFEVDVEEDDTTDDEGETDIIDRMREARAYDNQPRD